MSRPYQGSRQPNNIINLQVLEALPDVPVIISANQVIILMPIFRFCEGSTQYVDATGDYDLCMSLDGLYYQLTNRTTSLCKFAYRWVPPTIIQSLRNL